MAKRLVFDIVVDTKDPIDSLEGLREKWQELNAEPEKNAEAIKKVSDEIKKLESGLEKTGKGAKNAGKGIKGIGNSFKSVAKAAGIITIIVKAFETLKEALMRNQESAAALETATIALEIVLDTLVNKVVIPLAKWLLKAFTEPKKAVEELQKFLEPVGEWFNNLWIFIRDKFLVGILGLRKRLIEARIAWNEFTGDSDEAEELTNQLKDINDEIDTLNKSADEAAEKVKKPFVEGFEAAKKYVEETLKAASAQQALSQQAELDDINRQKRQLEFQKLAEDQRQIRDDESRSLEERIEANNRLSEILNEQNEEELKLVSTRLKAAEIAAQRNPKNIQAQKELLEAQREIADIEERIDSQRSEQFTNDVALRTEQLNRINAVIDAEKELADVTAETEQQKLNNAIIANDKKIQAFKDAGLTELAEYQDLVNQKAILEAQLTKAISDEIKKRNSEIKTENEKLFSNLEKGFKELGSSISEVFVGEDGLSMAISSAATNISSSFGGAVTEIGKLINGDEEGSLTGSISAALGAINSVIGGVGQILQEQSNQRIEQINRERDERIAALDAQYERGVLTEEELSKAKEAIDAEYKKKERKEQKKAFEQQKALQIVQAVIATAQGVINAFQLGPIAGAVMAAVIAGLGAAQIGIIASQKFPESGSAGGGASTVQASIGGASAGADAGAANDIIPPEFGINSGAVGGASNIAGEGVQAPVQNQPQQVYVVETDITSTQNQVEVVETSAQFG